MQRGAFSLRTVHHFWSDPCSSLSAGFIFISFCRIHVHLFLPDSACTFERSGSPRVLAPKNNAQYPIFVQKMPETGNRCHFHLLIPSIFEISGYQKAKYSCNTRRQEISSVSPSRRQEINSVSPSRRQEISSVSPSRRQEISHSKSTPHVPSQLHVLSPVPPALH